MIYGTKGPRGPQIRLVSLIYGRGTRTSWGFSIVRSLALVQALFGTFPPYCAHVHSCVCSYLILHLCCSHARGIQCGIHSSCMASLFPAVPCISGTLLWIHRAQVLLLGHQNTLTTESHTFFFIPKVLSEFQNNFSIIIYLDNYSQVYPGYRPDVCSRCLFPVLVLTLQR